MFEQVVKVEQARGEVQEVGPLLFLVLRAPESFRAATGNLRGGVPKQFYLSCPRNGGLRGSGSGSSSSSGSSSDFPYPYPCREVGLPFVAYSSPTPSASDSR